jgi:hypothetical protein
VSNARPIRRPDVPLTVGTNRTRTRAIEANQIMPYCVFDGGYVWGEDTVLNEQSTDTRFVCNFMEDSIGTGTHFDSTDNSILTRSDDPLVPGIIVVGGGLWWWRFVVTIVTQMDDVTTDPVYYTLGAGWFTASPRWYDSDDTGPNQDPAFPNVGSSPFQQVRVGILGGPGDDIRYTTKSVTEGTRSTTGRGEPSDAVVPELYEEQRLGIQIIKGCEDCVNATYDPDPSYKIAFTITATVARWSPVGFAPFATG